MRDFSKVSPQIWDSERFRNLPDDSVRLAYLYLLSNGHQNSIGCYRLPSAYACADLDWPAAKFEIVEKALVDATLVDVDFGTREVWIPLWFKHNPPTNPKHAQGAFRLVDKIISTRLRETVTEELQRAWAKWQIEHPSPNAGGNVSIAVLEANRRRLAASK